MGAHIDKTTKNWQWPDDKAHIGLASCTIAPSFRFCLKGGSVMRRVNLFSLFMTLFVLMNLSQGFAADIIIDEDITSDYTITQPVNTGDTCTIDTGVGEIDFESKVEVILKPGFTAPDTSEFHAFITGYEGGIGHNEVTGQVIVNGSGINGATVTLTGQTIFGQSVNLTTTTDENGNFSFSNVLEGTYTLSVSNDYYAFPPQGVTSSGTGNTIVVSDIVGIQVANIAGYLLGGAFSVDKNGAGNYVMPIQTPPGINGLEPNLSIKYSSSTGNGLLGVGFSLSGIPAITRGPTDLVRSNTFDPVDFDTNDRFCMNGQDLICINGYSYGADGAEYRTELETFSKIVSNGSDNGAPQSFTVWTKNGLIMTFGATESSRIRTQDDNILLWSLERIEDRAGNLLLVTYDQTDFEFWPDKIEYAFIDTSPNCKVEFQYTTNCPLTDTSYVKGNLRQISRTLTNIKTYAANELVTDYFLNYDYSNNKSRLVSISQCNAQMGCMDPVVFTRVNDDGLDDFHQNNYGECSNLYSYLYAKVGDFNGDSRNDLLYAGVDNNFYVWLSDEGVFDQVGNSQDQYQWGTGYDPDNTFKTGDFNGDGKDDVVEVYGDHLYVWKTNVNGDGFEINKGDWADLSNDYPRSNLSECWVEYYYIDGGLVTNRIPKVTSSHNGFDIGDFNGDGKMDIIHHVRVRTATDQEWEEVEPLVFEYTYTYTYSYCSYIYLSTGSSFVRSGSYWRSSSRANTQLGDFNGDGMTDLVEFSGENAYVWLSNGTGFDYSSLTQPWGTGLDDSTSEYSKRVGDFNGDGKTDFVCYFPDDEILKVWLSTGIGFITPDNAWGTGFRNGQKIYIGDFNGDGKADVLAKNAVIGGTVQYGTIVYLSTGQSFTANNGDDLTYKKWTVDGATSSVYLGSLLLADITGDGSTDILSLSGTDGTTIIQYSSQSSLKTNDLISEITDGLGKAITIQYDSLTSSVYTKYNDAQYPIRDYQGPMYVVSNHTVSNGNGGVNTYGYEYEGAKIDLERRRFLGFNTVTKHDQQRDFFTISTYLQGFPFTGLINNVEVRRDSDTGNLVKKIENASHVHVHTQGSYTDYAYDTYNLSSIADDMTFFPYTGTNVATDYYLTGSPVKETTTTYSYTGYGYPASKSVSAVANGFTYSESIVNSEFADDVAEWIIGKPGKTVVTVSDEDGNSYYADGSPKTSTTLTTNFEYYSSSDVDGYPGQLKTKIIESENTDTSIKLTTSYTYDDHGNLESEKVTGDNGYATSEDRETFYVYTYFSDVYELTITNPENIDETYSYTWKFGKPVSYTDPNGLGTTWEYDTFGRQTLETRADGTTTAHEYIKDGSYSIDGTTYNAPYHIFATTTGKANETMYVDMFNREVFYKTTGAGGEEIDKYTQYDNQGLVHIESQLHFTGGNPQETIYVYDDLDRLESVDSFATGQSNFMYNQESDALTTVVTRVVTKPNSTTQNQVTKQTANAQGLISKVVDAANNTTIYGYDPLGKLDYIKDTADNETFMVYDKRGRKIKMTDPDMGTWNYACNAFSDLVVQTDAKSQALYMHYDKLGRILSKSDGNPGTNTYTWTYDVYGTATANGKLMHVTGPDDYSETYSYNSYYQPEDTTISVKDDNGTLYSYTTTNHYDSYRRLNQIEYPAVEGSRFSVFYEYQETYGYLEKVCNQDESTTYWQADGRNALGHVTDFKLHNANMHTTRHYDTDDGRLDSITTGPEEFIAGVQLLSYEYDSIGNLITRTNSLSTSEPYDQFEYDTLNRLDYSTGVSPRDYGYSAIGNMTGKTGVSGTYIYGTQIIEGETIAAGPHAVTSVGDSAGDNIYRYDSNGNMTSGGGCSFTFNAFNRPVRVEDADDSNVYANFVYDASDMLVKQTINDGTTETETIFIGSLYEKVKTASATEHRHYIMAQGQTFAIYTKKSDSTEQMRYLHTDNLGSTDVITDENGNIIENISFYSFGQGREGTDTYPDDGDVTWTGIKDVPTGIMSRGFTGHLQLDLFGLVHMQGRIYDYTLGRFISPDPYVQDPYNPQCLNRYSYCLNNPLKYVDPSGYGINDYETVFTMADDGSSWSILNDLELAGFGGSFDYGFVEFPQIEVQVYTSDGTGLDRQLYWSAPPAFDIGYSSHPEKKEIIRSCDRWEYDTGWSEEEWRERAMTLSFGFAGGMNLVGSTTSGLSNLLSYGKRLWGLEDDLAMGSTNMALISHPFEYGATHITTLDRLKAAAIKYPMFGADTGLYVAPTEQINSLLARGSSRMEIEIALGIEKGGLSGSPLVRIDISNPFSHGLRLADPSTGNALHIPNSGITLGGLNECVINPIAHPTRPNIIKGY